MAQSETQIMNSALIKLGAEVILSPDDDSDRARVMKTQYPLSRNKLLRSHPWNFAIEYASLAAIDPKPSNVFEYSYVYNQPSDCLRPLILGNSCNQVKWEEIAGKRIASDSSEANLKYIKLVTDTTKYDAVFDEALAYQLAEDTAYYFRQSTEQVAVLRDERKKLIAEGRSYDAQTGSVRRIISDDIKNARRY